MSGRAVQIGKLIAKLGLDSALEISGKKRMVAVPLAFLVERGQQQLPLLDRCKQRSGRLAPATASHNGAQSRSSMDVRSMNATRSGGRPASISAR